MSLEDSAKRLGLPFTAKQWKGMAIAAVVGFIVSYGVMPFVGVGLLTGGDPGLNSLLMSLLTGLITFAIAFKLCKPSQSTARQAAPVARSRNAMTGTRPVAETMPRPKPQTRGMAAFCPNCGRPTSGRRFCTNCGIAIP